jgi:hypothetical protein
MPKTERRSATNVSNETREGLRVGLHKAFAEVTGEPLPAAHIDLLLTMRQREREKAGRSGA